MATFGVAAKARVSLVTPQPTGAIPPGSSNPDFADIQAPSTWAAIWFVILVLVVWAIFAGLLF